MADKVNLAELETKVAAGGKLTAAEMKEVMSMPNDPELSNKDITPEDDISDADFDEPAVPETTLANKPGEKKAETKPAEQTPAPAAKTTETPAKPAEETPQAKLDKELAKPEGQEDLSSFSDREKGYFWEMRRERRARQKAEEELAIIKFNKIKEDQAKAKETPADAPKVKTVEEIEEELFAGRDPLEPLTVQDIRELRKKAREEAAKQTQPKTTVNPVFGVDVNSVPMQTLFKLQEDNFKIGVQDYDEVVECVQDIVKTNPKYLQQIADSIKNGENTAKVVYTIIKGDPEFLKVLPIAQARLKAKGIKTTAEAAPAEETPAKKKAIETQEKLKNNNEKPKTAGNAGGSEDVDTSKQFGQYSADELMSMTDLQFAKVPKKIRDAFMQEFGS